MSDLDKKVLEQGDPVSRVEGAWNYCPLNDVVDNRDVCKWGPNQCNRLQKKFRNDVLNGTAPINYFPTENDKALDCSARHILNGSET